MAHQIENKDGKWSFAFTGDRSAIWHGLGQQAQPTWTREDWINESGHNFTVRKLAIEGVCDDGRFEYSEHGLLQRTDTNAILSLVTEQWNPAQNIDAWEFAEPLVKAGFASYDTAGTLFDGKRCFLLLKTKEGFQLPDGDDTEGYILVMISHVYGIADLALPTSIRVVCNNTLQFALQAAAGQKKLNPAKFVHAGRKSFDAEKAAALIEAYRLGLGEYAEKAKFLSSSRTTPERTRAYINKVFEIKALTKGTDDEKMRHEINNQKIVDSLLAAVNEQPGANMSEGSWWQNFHAVTWFEDHGQFKVDPEGRGIVDRFTGKSATRKQFALDVALEMAKA